MPQKPTDLRGHRFGRLVAIEPAPKMFPGQRYSWRCLCDCGTEKTTSAHELKLGHTQSCGCYRIEWNKTHKTTHGMYGTPENCAWRAMKARCEHASHPAFKNYGGRGIRVCERWRVDFSNFYADVGPRPTAKHTLDRINNEGHYEPTNCRWATAQVQATNRRKRKPRQSQLHIRTAK